MCCYQIQVTSHIYIYYPTCNYYPTCVLLTHLYFVYLSSTRHHLHAVSHQFSSQSCPNTNGCTRHQGNTALPHFHGNVHPVTKIPIIELPLLGMFNTSYKSCVWIYTELYYMEDCGAKYERYLLLVSVINCLSSVLSIHLTGWHFTALPSSLYLHCILHHIKHTSTLIHVVLGQFFLLEYKLQEFNKLFHDFSRIFMYFWGLTNLTIEIILPVTRNKTSYFWQLCGYKIKTRPDWSYQNLLTSVAENFSATQWRFT